MAHWIRFVVISLRSIQSYARENNEILRLNFIDEREKETTMRTFNLENIRCMADLMTRSLLCYDSDIMWKITVALLRESISIYTKIRIR